MILLMFAFLNNNARTQPQCFNNNSCFKMKFLIYLFLILTGLFCFSCEKEVVLDIQHTPALCVVSLLSPDSTIKARVTLSRALPDTGKITTVSNARVTISENGQHKWILNHAGNGYYTINEKPLPGKNYSISVEAPGFDPVSGKTTVPLKPEISHFYSDTTIFFESRKWYLFSVNIRINDKPGKNTYWFFMPYTDNIYKGTSIMNIQMQPYFDNFTRFNDVEARYGYVYEHYLRIADTGYDGKPLFINATTRTNAWNVLFAADEHFDKYMKSTLKLGMVDDIEDWPFRTSVQIHSNIENGWGIFGAISMVKFQSK